MITLILVIIAAILNAVMDRVETTISFKVSIFSKYNISFWCKPISAHNAGFLPFTKFRKDGWHLAKAGMIWALLLAVVFYQPLIPWFTPWLDFVLFGILWNAIFNIFYNHILKL